MTVVTRSWSIPRLSFENAVDSRKAEEDNMTEFIARTVTANGFEESALKTESTGEMRSEILADELDTHFDQWTAQSSGIAVAKFLDENKVCFKQEIASISHPFQTKVEYEDIIVDIPFNGRARTRGRPRLYRRSVTYIVSANICYPVDLVIAHVERCAKQGALAASAIALTGALPATQAAFQAAFLTCMAAADFPNADQIDVQVTGDKVHGDWHPV